MTATDGENVYVSSATNDAILIFDRNVTTGRRMQKSGVLGCVTTSSAIATNEGSNPTAPPASALSGPQALAVSPDSKTLYTVTDNGFITSFNRDDDGTLTFNQTENTGFGLPFRSVTVSPDGRSVYFVGPSDNNSAVVWRIRNTIAGEYTLGDLTPGACYACGCTFDQVNQGVWTDVAVTPYGKELLLTTSDANPGGDTNSVVGWDRATSGDVG